MQNLRRKNETGRSMVEMLGVLAIVGVLSVGGVYGYGVAMKKHKANEALHKASMLATTVSAYAMSNDGNLPSSIADFANLGYDTALSDNGTQFKLTISGLEDGVCKQMQSSKGGIAQGVECDETTGNATLTYYKNLATTEAEGEKSPTGGSGAGSPDSCTSAIVNVYNCETKTTTPCCPDNGNSCEQPQCSCDNDDDCSEQQVCLGGFCGCANGGEKSETDSSVCCSYDGHAWDGDGYDGVHIACLDEGEELYCMSTNSAGECYEWDVCDTGNNTGDSIIGMPYAYGTCAGEGYEIYCYSTDSAGECNGWGSCETGKSTGDSIEGISYAGGACAYEGAEVYCFTTNSAGECNYWSVCETGKSTGDSIIGIPDAVGGCADEGEEVYCKYTNSAGKCTAWWECEIGKSVSASGPNATGTCN